MGVEPDDLIVHLGAVAEQIDNAGLFVFENRLGLGQVAGQRPIASCQLINAGVQFTSLVLQTYR